MFEHWNILYIAIYLVSQKVFNLHGSEEEEIGNYLLSLMGN